MPLFLFLQYAPDLAYPSFYASIAGVHALLPAILDASAESSSAASGQKLTKVNKEGVTITVDRSE